ncbi:hypothetical protein ACG2LH_01235 [Zhouia sp. PK063]|uniref:hypothetical protein n=1 Tax=Zhouia sp. PK063 TaxID=3373602 RepID=UPI0037B33225
MELLFTAKNYTVYQSLKERCFYIDFDEKLVKLSFCELLAFRQKINQINIDTHFDRAVNNSGLEIISLCNKKHLFIFDTLQIIALKKLVNGAIAALEFSSSLEKILL